MISKCHNQIPMKSLFLPLNNFFLFLLFATQIEINIDIFYGKYFNRRQMCNVIPLFIILICQLSDRRKIHCLVSVFSLSEHFTIIKHNVHIQLWQQLAFHLVNLVNNSKQNNDCVLYPAMTSW